MTDKFMDALVVVIHSLCSLRLRNESVRDHELDGRTNQSRNFLVIKWDASRYFQTVKRVIKGM
jgi:hypothetical protein